MTTEPYYFPTSPCKNPEHDHVLEANDTPGACNDCRQPAHYDKATEQYHHDDDNSTPCFLTAPNDPPHTPCQLPIESIKIQEDIGIFEPFYKEFRLNLFPDGSVTWSNS